MEPLISEEWLRGAVGLLVRIVEMAAVVIIFSGAAVAFARFAFFATRGMRGQSFVNVRLDLGRYLTLGLEFQLASDLLRTAVAPSFREIGQLAAVAAIRTALNYFLAREIREEREEVAQKGVETAPATPP